MVGRFLENIIYDILTSKQNFCSDVTAFTVFFKKKSLKNIQRKIVSCEYTKKQFCTKKENPQCFWKQELHIDLYSGNNFEYLTDEIKIREIIGKL